MTTIAQHLADFTSGADFDALPPEVVDESKRLILDSVGCALGAVDQPKGRIGIEYGLLTGGGCDQATIIGTDRRASIFGAAFANGELINTLDFDAVLPPGHVSPYVLPGALATAEAGHASGRELLVATAVAHEMSYRFAKSMDYLRDIKDGAVDLSPIIGYSATIFGATAAIGRLDGFTPAQLADAIAIAANTTPVNSHRSWLGHAPSATIKYLLAGGLAQSAYTAAYMAKLGHRGDLQVFDDAEIGYRRFIGTRRWEPQNITDGLGETWRFPAESTIKPYPHCRILHGLLDVMTDILDRNDIRPEEITAIRTWGEASVMHPVWLTREVTHVHDAQFSIAHGIAVGAHRVVPSKAWHDPALVFGSSVMDLMDRVTFEPHPQYAVAITAHPSSRPSRVEIDARGETFSGESLYPKGSPSPDPVSTMTTDEVVAKFRVNADGVLSPGRTDAVVAAILGLEAAADAADVIRLLATDLA